MLVDDIQPVILAGGGGLRLRRVLPDLPKPMAPAAGRPFIEWIIRHLATGGFRRVLISTGHLAEVVDRFFADHSVADMEVRCIREPTPLGTAGGFLHAVEQTGWSPAAWLVLNGDSLTFVDWPALAARLDRAEVDGVVVACWMEETGRFGRLQVDADQRLTAFQEKSPARSRRALINAGIYLLRHRLLEACPSRRPLAFEQDLFPSWLESGRYLEVHPVATDFLDIGTEATLPEADTFIRRHRGYFR